MSTNRITRVNELLRREIGEVLFSILRETDFDLAAVTITQVITSRDLRTAKVMISIRNHVPEREKMLSEIRSHRVEIQRHINKDIVLKYTPRLSFELDRSIERGDRVLHLLSELEEREEERDEPEGPDAAR